MGRGIALVFLGLVFAFPGIATDVYGAAPTAQTTALGGIYLGAPGPADALASNPALLTSVGKPYLELTGMGVLAGGQFHNSTPYIGCLESNAGISGSAAFGMQIPHTRLSLGFWRGSRFPALRPVEISRPTRDRGRLLRNPVQQVSFSSDPIFVWPGFSNLSLAIGRTLVRSGRQHKYPGDALYFPD